VNAGQVWLAVAAVLLSLIGAFYYLRVVKLMYFDEPRDSLKQALPVSAGGAFSYALSANGLAMLLFGIAPSLLMNPCLEAIKALRPY
jgi:NADH-quinone oxidoreductase subunit N